MMNVKTLIGAALLVSTVPLALADETSQSELQLTSLHFGMFNIEAEVAATPRQREIGLMNRLRMDANHGMLFVFEEASPQCFWMRNTRIPLSIAFLDEDGTVVNLADMKPMDESTHCSVKPVRFALEMNQGWFVKHGVKPGDKIAGPARSR